MGSHIDKTAAAAAPNEKLPIITNEMKTHFNFSRTQVFFGDNIFAK